MAATAAAIASREVAAPNPEPKITTWGPKACAAVSLMGTDREKGWMKEHNARAASEASGARPPKEPARAPERLLTLLTTDRELSWSKAAEAARGAPHREQSAPPAVPEKAAPAAARRLFDQIGIPSKPVPSRERGLSKPKAPPPGPELQEQLDIARAEEESWQSYLQEMDVHGDPIDPNRPANWRTTPDPSPFVREEVALEVVGFELGERTFTAGV